MDQPPRPWRETVHRETSQAKPWHLLVVVGMLCLTCLGCGAAGMFAAYLASR